MAEVSVISCEYSKHFRKFETSSMKRFLHTMFALRYEHFKGLLAWFVEKILCKANGVCVLHVLRNVVAHWGKYLLPIPLLQVICRRGMRYG